MHKFSMKYRIIANSTHINFFDFFYLIWMQILSFFNSLVSKNCQEKWFFSLVDDFFKDRLKIKSKLITIIFLMLGCLILCSFFMYFINQLRAYSGQPYNISPENLKGYSFVYFIVIVLGGILLNSGKSFLTNLIMDDNFSLICILPFLLLTTLNIEFILRKLFFGNNNANSSKGYTKIEFFLMENGLFFIMINITYLIFSMFFIKYNLNNIYFFKINILFIMSNLFSLLIFIFYFLVFIMALITSEIFIFILVFLFLYFFISDTNIPILFF